jgi:GNAT superfamily N-acetyltransferase
MGALVRSSMEAGVSETGSSEFDLEPTETVARLHDGTLVVLRSIRVGDRPEVAAFVHRLSEETVELRFCAPVRSSTVLDEVLGTGVSPERLVIVAETLETPARILATAEFVPFRSDRSCAEIAFLVEDDAQGLGAGSLLLQELVRRARLAGIRQLVAVVMAENLGMREVLTRSWYPYRLKEAGSSETFILDIAPAESAHPAARIPT